MHTKLAGRLPLHEMITQHIDAARAKLAAAEEKSEEKKKEKKLLAFEKKEHGHTPSVKEEEAEKTASIDGILDHSDPEQIEKLASALDTVAEKLAGDSIFNGGEKKQGGEQLATQGPTPGKQPYKKDQSKSHNVPMHTPEKATKDNPGPANAVETDEKRQVGPDKKQPPNILRKTAAQTVLERIEAKRQVAAGEAVEVPEKTAAAVDYVLGKIAKVENGGESKQGGEQLSNTAPVPSNPGRQLIASNKAPVSATKREAKSPRKAELSQVLTEPAFSRAHDSKVHENLRNADKGGVKIAAAKALLQKIAAEGCTCKDGEPKGSCRHCKLKTAVAKRQSAKA